MTTAAKPEDRSFGVASGIWGPVSPGTELYPRLKPHQHPRRVPSVSLLAMDVLPSSDGNGLREPLLPSPTLTVEGEEDDTNIDHNESNMIDVVPPSSATRKHEEPAAMTESGDETTLANEETRGTIRANDSDSDNVASIDEPTVNPWKNHNVLLSLALCGVSGVADSIWSSVVLSGFLLALAGSMGKASRGNTLVGTAEAVQGMTQLVIALPVGFLADTWSKSKTMKLGGILMLVTIALTLWALIDIDRWAEESQAEASRCYIILVVALGLWGIIDGISYGPSQALFSDSIPRGKRSEMLTWLYSCYLLSSAVGPIVSITLILTVSANATDWSLAEIFPVFFLGVCLEFPAALLMFFFSDKHVVPETSVSTVDETPRCENDNVPGSTPTRTVAVSNRDDDDTPESSNNVADNQTIPLLDDNIDPSEDGSTLARRRRNKYKAYIPYVIFVSSLISSLGSGASVKYFPLFFKEVGFGSAEVQAIYLMVPIFISLFSFAAQVAGKRLGRVEATFGSILIGVALLLWMTWLSHGVGKRSGDELSSTTSLWQADPRRALLVVGVYLLRTGIINCSYPLLESILMDSVPSNQRARWKSLESIASFGWTGSAFVGGILSDTHSYQFTFTMTAWMQLASGVLLLLIQPLVDEEGS